MRDNTVITYQGGAAGDMFAAGANGFEVDFSENAYVHRPGWSIKMRETAIKQGDLDLCTAVRDTCCAFVTTHLYEPLRSLDVSKISILVQDPEIIERTILRQMKLQMLSIEINTQHTAYRLIKTAADQKDWDRAAQLWLAMAKKVWQQERLHRIKYPLAESKILIFDRLYHEDFVDSLRQQGFKTNLDMIAHNHLNWLKSNSRTSLDQTLQSMIGKLKNMDWNQDQGSITYDRR